MWFFVAAFADQAGAVNFDAWDQRLESALAQSEWHQAPDALDPSKLQHLVQQLETHAKSPLTIASSPTAWRTKTDWASMVVSNLRVSTNADKSVATMALGTSSVDSSGRGMTTINDDFLVVFEQGRPSHVYQVHIQNAFMDSWTRTLWTLERDDQGVLVGAKEEMLDHGYHVETEGKPVGFPEATTKRTRTRRQF